ncbi:MAG: hypothetical protein CSA21_01215 [Deltaproteobacteria bacterium]|nr:MAG: hypothetical protein CSA21_01215 [Deltaproteobacteria bacterium]
MISVPFYREGELEGFFRLPFRESGEYPEVEESFLLLREKYEQIIREAYAHEPIDIRGELDLSAETKKAIAAKLTAKKILSLCA